MTAVRTIGQRVADLAEAHPERAALVALSRNGSATTVGYRELDRRANHCAAVLARHGLGAGDVVVIALPNGVDHVVATLAGWKLGATVLPLDPRSPAGDTAQILTDVAPALFVGVPRQELPIRVVDPVEWGSGESHHAPPEPSGPPRSALATGGTTGRPKVVVRRRPWTFDPGALPSPHDRAVGLTAGQVQLVTMPLFHGGFGALHHGLALGHTLVTTPMFIPRLVAEAIERYRVNVLRLVPTMMRLLLEPGGVLGRDLSSVTALHHGTGPCPPEVKLAWLDLLGPERVYESYGAQEQIGFVWIRGDEWLRHPGSVGRPAPGTVAVVVDGEPAAPGVVGEVFLRPATAKQPEYLGSGPQLVAWRDEYLSVGDLGYLDADGYLFIKGRVQETINVGGAKVYPAEVEAVLTSHPGIADACVVGRTHPIRGQVPHALVVPTDPELSQAELDAYCRARLTLHKVPASYEFTATLPRNDAGKLRRGTVSVS
ncbi:AMP-binding protein [Micromonospora sp. NPDC047074]|uniref:class I adenylate-forming enzyme family protein n=1 Tax=Micromonospora sp. NPDC047074 TaxID=3154339 RepID=UPI0033FA6BEC